MRLIIVSRVPGVDPVPDTTAPNAPTNLTATAVGQNQINLAWNASTDNPGGSGIAGYRAYRNGSSIPLAPLTIGTGFSDTGLTAATTYTYRVSAVDNATNESAQSAQAQATTQSASSAPAWAVSSTSVNFAQGTASSFDLRTLMTGTFTPGTHGVSITSGTLATGVTLNANLYQLDYDGVGTQTGIAVTFADPGAYVDAEFSWLTSQRGERGTSAQTGVLPFPSMNFPSQSRFNKGQFKTVANGSTCTWDQTIKRSGAGSLKQIIPAGNGETTNSQWRSGFVDTTTAAPFGFTAGQRFFFQRVFQCDSAFVNNRLPASSGFAFGPKNWILAHSDKAGFDTTAGAGVGQESGNSMNPGVELACEWQSQENAPLLYNTNDGSTLASTIDTSSDGTYTDNSGAQHQGYQFDLRYYNQLDRGAGVSRKQERYAPTKYGGRTSSGSPGTGAITPKTSSTGSYPIPSNYQYPGIEAGIWYAEMVEIVLGGLGSGPSVSPDKPGSVPGFANSTVRLWRGPAGQAPTILGVYTGSISRESGASAGPGVGNWLDPADGDDFGKIWLTTFCTGAVASSRPVGSIYTDYIIVASKPIPFPGGFNAPLAGT